MRDPAIERLPRNISGLGILHGRQYNVFEIRWFEEFLAAYTIDNVIRPDQSMIEAYRGKLPEYLLQFWADHGWCSWSEGKYWLCDPALPKPVVNQVFQGDPEFDPDRMVAFGYTAFGEIDIWYGDATIRLNLLMNKVRVEPREFDEDISGIGPTRLS